MTKATAGEKLGRRIGALSTTRLIDMHPTTVQQMYAAVDAVPQPDRGTASEPYQIVVDAITAELERRGVAFEPCCYTPVGARHDERICDRSAGTERVRTAADAILEAAFPSARHNDPAA